MICVRKNIFFKYLLLACFLLNNCLFDLQMVHAASTVVINVLETGYTETGTWSTNSAKGYNDTPTRISGNNGDTAKWTPTLEAGRYRVYIWKVVTGTPGGSSSDPNAKIEVVYSGGIRTVYMDWTRGTSGFVDLGVFEFEAGASGYVRITKNGPGFGRTSAVKFESYTAGPQSYYVSTTGDDTNSGAIDSPFKTIQQAANVMEAGDTCYIRGGTYRETVTVPRSGTASNRMAFKNYPGEDVVISGADPVTGWTQYSGSIYKAPVTLSLPAVQNQIFVSNKMMLQARWPNTDTNSSNYLLQPNLAKSDSCTLTSIKDADLTQTDNFFANAKLWSETGQAYCSQTTTVTASSQANHQITFTAFPWSGGSYDPLAGNTYFLYGKLNLLDTEGEWYYDSTASTLYLWAPGGADPSTLTVEAKQRRYGFVLDDRSYIDIQGELNSGSQRLSLFANTVSTNSNTSNCTVDGIKNTYVAHSDDTAQGNAYLEGFLLYGNNNVLRNSELSYSAASIVRVSGAGNQIINCHLQYGDYMGTNSSIVHGSLVNGLISNNTLNDAGRSCLAFTGNSSSNIVQYNDMYNALYLTNDSGIFYDSNFDGQFSRIHHNKVHDSKAAGFGVGIYLDSSSENFIVDHNIIWNCHDALRLNTPSCYNLIYNNTCGSTISTSIGYTGGTYKSDMFGTRIFNNIFTKSIGSAGGAVVGNNIYSGTNPQFINAASFDYHLQNTSPAKDTGRVIPEITDGYAGSLPDCGAYENGTADWAVGYNFYNPSNSVYVVPDITYMNKVKNGGFEAGNLTSWTQNGTNISVASGNGWSSIVSTARMQNYGVKIGGTSSGVEQVITGLTPNTSYTFSAWVKAENGETVEAGIKNYGGTTISKSMSENLWQQLTINFITGAGNEGATIYISKTSSGSSYVYADDMGVVERDRMVKTEDFEELSGHNSSWIATGETASASSAQAHSGSYSYAVDEDRDIIACDMGGNYNKIVSLWFYDDASDTQMKCIADVGTGDQANWRAMGVDTTVAEGSAHYVYYSGSTKTATSIARTTGWHELKWDYTSGNGVDMYIDRVKVLSVTGVTSFNKISMGDFWADGITGRVYFDDVAMYDLDANFGTFENGFGGWSTAQTPVAAWQKQHSGKLSYVMDEDVDYLSKTFSIGQNSEVSMWFYDDTTKIDNKCFGYVDNGSGSQRRGIGIVPGNDTYVYDDGTAITSTSKARSSGWHEFKWNYTSGISMDMYIDGTKVATLNGVTSFTKIELGDFWADGKISNLYFDDIILKDRAQFKVIHSDFTDRGGKVITSLANQASINARIELVNTQITGVQPVWLAIALYKNNVLVNLNTIPIKVKMDWDVQTIEAETDLSSEIDTSGYVVKQFLWDGANTMQPLSTVHIIQ